MLNISEENLVPIVAVSIGCSVVVIWMLLTAITTILTRAQVERSRRDIAAYIAEGSMTPEEGQRLLSASPEQVKTAAQA